MYKTLQYWYVQQTAPKGSFVYASKESLYYLL